MRGFLLIVIAGLGCAILGGGLGWVVGHLSPEFVALLARPSVVSEPERLGAALGLVSGRLLGAGAMAFGLLVEAFRVWATNRPARQAPQPTDLATGGSSSCRVRAV